MSWSILPCPQHDQAKSCLFAISSYHPPFHMVDGNIQALTLIPIVFYLQVNQSARSSWDTKRAARTGFVRTKHLYKTRLIVDVMPLPSKILKDQIEEDRNGSLSFTSTCCRGGLPLITVYDARLVHTHQPPNSIVPNSSRSASHVQASCIYTD